VDTAGDLLWLTLLTGVLCGVANVLVDVDHLLPLLRKTRTRGRVLHRSFFAVGLCGLACAGGLLLIMVLAYRRQKIKSQTIIVENDKKN
jgi:hypothetical protein